MYPLFECKHPTLGEQTCLSIISKVQDDAPQPLKGHLLLSQEKSGWITYDRDDLNLLWVCRHHTHKC